MKNDPYLAAVNEPDQEPLPKLRSYSSKQAWEYESNNDYNPVDDLRMQQSAAETALSEGAISRAEYDTIQSLDDTDRRTYTERVLGYRQHTSTPFGPLNSIAQGIETFGGFRLFVTTSMASLRTNLGMKGQGTEDVRLPSPNTPTDFVDRLAHHYKNLGAYARIFAQGFNVGINPAEFKEAWGKQIAYSDVLGVGRDSSDAVVSGLVADIMLDPTSWLSFGVTAAGKVAHGAEALEIVGRSAGREVAHRSLTLNRWGEAIYKQAIKEAEANPALYGHAAEHVRSGATHNDLLMQGLDPEFHKWLSKHVVENYDRLAGDVAAQFGRLRKIDPRTKAARYAELKAGPAAMYNETYNDAMTRVAGRFGGELLKVREYKPFTALLGAEVGHAALSLFGAGDVGAVAGLVLAGSSTARTAIDRVGLLMPGYEAVTRKVAGSAASFMTERFTAATNRLPEATRNAMVLADREERLHADGLIKNLHDFVRESKLSEKDFVAVARHLDNPKDYPIPDGLEQVAYDFREKFDAIIRREQEAGIDVNYWENYVTHYYGDRDGKGVVNWFLDKLGSGRNPIPIDKGLFDGSSPFALHRLVATFDDADRMFGPGVVRDNIVEIYARRVRASSRAIASKKMYDDAVRLYAIDAPKSMKELAALVRTNQRALSQMARKVSNIDIDFGTPFTGPQHRVTQESIDSFVEAFSSTRPGKLVVGAKNAAAAHGRDPAKIKNPLEDVGAMTHEALAAFAKEAYDKPLAEISQAQFDQMADLLSTVFGVRVNKNLKFSDHDLVLVEYKAARSVPTRTRLMSANLQRRAAFEVHGLDAPHALDHAEGEAWSLHRVIEHAGKDIPEPPKVTQYRESAHTETMERSVYKGDRSVAIESYRKAVDYEIQLERYIADGEAAIQEFIKRGQHLEVDPAIVDRVNRNLLVAKERLAVATKDVERMYDEFSDAGRAAAERLGRRATAEQLGRRAPTDPSRVREPLGPVAARRRKLESALKTLDSPAVQAHRAKIAERDALRNRLPEVRSSLDAARERWRQAANGSAEKRAARAEVNEHLATLREYKAMNEALENPGFGIARKLESADRVRAQLRALEDVPEVTIGGYSAREAERIRRLPPSLGFVRPKGRTPQSDYDAIVEALAARSARIRSMTGSAVAKLGDAVEVIDSKGRTRIVRKGGARKFNLFRNIRSVQADQDRLARRIAEHDAEWNKYESGLVAHLDADPILSKIGHSDLYDLEEKVAKLRETNLGPEWEEAHNKVLNAISEYSVVRSRYKEAVDKFTQASMEIDQDVELASQLLRDPEFVKHVAKIEGLQAENARVRKKIADVQRLAKDNRARLEAQGDPSGTYYVPKVLVDAIQEMTGVQYDRNKLVDQGMAALQRTNNLFKPFLLFPRMDYWARNFISNTILSVTWAGMRLADPRRMFDVAKIAAAGLPENGPYKWMGSLREWGRAQKIRIGAIEYTGEQIVHEAARRGVMHSHSVNEYEFINTLAGPLRGATLIRPSFAGAAKAVGNIVANPVEVMREAGSAVGRIFRPLEYPTETVHRLGLFVEAAKETGSFARATEVVADHLNDWSRLSSFEKKYMRAVFPFYSWTRFAVGRTLRTLGESPNIIQNESKALAALQRYVMPGSSYEEDASGENLGWLESSIGIVAEGPGDLYQKFTVFGLIEDDAFRIARDAAIAGKSMLHAAANDMGLDKLAFSDALRPRGDKEVATKLLANMAFLPKAVAEIATGREFYTGAAIRGDALEADNFRTRLSSSAHLAPEVAATKINAAGRMWVLTPEPVGQRIDAYGARALNYMLSTNAQGQSEPLARYLFDVALPTSAIFSAYESRMKRRLAMLASGDHAAYDHEVRDLALRMLGSRAYVYDPKKNKFYLNKSRVDTAKKILLDADYYQRMSIDYRPKR